MSGLEDNVLIKTDLANQTRLISGRPGGKGGGPPVFKNYRAMARLVYFLNLPGSSMAGAFRNSKLNYMSQTQAQKEKIKAYLQKGKGLTALEALRKFGCFRLAARIKNLSDEGVQIKRQWIKTKNGKHIVRYSI